MKIALVVLGVALAVLAEEGDEPIIFNYHEDIGIPTAEEIRDAESQGSDGLRIIGGSLTSPGQFPHFAGLLIDLTSGKQSVCGSSLISKNKALTAAHCWWDGKNRGRQLTVVLGSTRLYSGGTRVTTDKVETHENWNTKRLENDIAMITIDSVEFSDVIKTVAFATGSDDYAGVTAMIVGFGRTGTNEPITKDQVLRNVSMEVITNNECRRSYGSYIRESNICTSTARGTRATCQGDSGGPLTVGSDEDLLQIGIVSFGGKTCTSGTAKALTRVTYYASWINERL